MNIIIKGTAPEYVVRPERIAGALRQSEREAGARPAKGEFRGGDGFLAYRFPRALVVNAVAGHGESLDDEGYWEDMARRHPECRVKYEGKAGRRMPDAGCRMPDGRGRMPDAREQMLADVERVSTRFGRGRRYRYED